MTIWLGLLTLGAYLLGALPLSYLTAKWQQGIDLRQYGTGQVGAGNLWRMTASWKIGLPIGLFDLGKGMLMIWVARLAGLDITQQIVVGLAAVIGHNWSVFLRFSGGRGIGTSLGVVAILPLINNLTPWDIITCITPVVIILIFFHTTPLSLLAGFALVPVVSWRLHEPLPITLGFLTIFLIIVIKRLTAPRSAESASVGKGQLILNRLLFDRDIRDRKLWMYRRPIRQQGEREG